MSLPTAIDLAHLETELFVSQSTTTRHGNKQSAAQLLVGAATSVAVISPFSTGKYSTRPGVATLIGYMTPQSLLHRPIRTLITVVAVALEVTFVILVAALASSLLRVLTNMAVIARFLVIFMFMYRATIGRTYEVGVLKSLGAPKRCILGIILADTILLCLAGLFVGVGLSYGLRSIILIVYHSLPIPIRLSWIACAGLMAITGGLLGAAFAAWLASCKDPVEILPYE